jgi:hypothetical protein
MPLIREHVITTPYSQASGQFRLPWLVAAGSKAKELEGGGHFGAVYATFALATTNCAL